MISRIRARRGALWLDATKPGWWKLVNLDLLSMSSGRWCVAGQVFDEEARNALYFGGYNYLRGKMGVKAAFRRGFNVDAWATYTGLSKAWTREIRKRKEAARP